jgi:hypothetical protein
MSFPVSRSSVAKAFVAALCLSAAWLAACTKGTSPPPPAGGGGTVGGTGAELSGSLAPGGGTYVHTFNTAGTFNYHCTIHSTCGSLAGTIVVVDPATAIKNRILAISQSGGSTDPYNGATCSSLSVSRDSVHTGDTVTWTNNSPFSHNVVSR